MRSDRVLKGLPELYQMDRWLEQADLPARVHTLSAVECGDDCLPIYCFEMGSAAATAPVVIFSDQNAGQLLSILRRREEHYYGFSSNWNDDKEALARVASDLSDAGYDTQEAS